MIDGNECAKSPWWEMTENVHNGCDIMNEDDDNVKLQNEETIGENKVEAVPAQQRDAEVQTSPVQMANKEMQTQTIPRLELTQASPILRPLLCPESDVPQSPCFQFDRLASARVSLSPSFRKLKKKVSVQPPTLPQKCQEVRKDGIEEPTADNDASTPANGTDKLVPSSVPSSDIIENVAVAKLDQHPTADLLTDDQRHLHFEEPPTQPQEPQAVTEINGVDRPLSVNPEGGDHHIVCEQSATDQENLSLWERRRGDKKIALPTVSQQTADDSIPRRHSTERRRTSVVVSLPGLDVFPGDLLISDGADSLTSALTPNTDTKKSKWPFTRRGMVQSIREAKNKGKQKQTSELENVLASLKLTEQKDYGFQQYQYKCWTQVMETQSLTAPDTDLETCSLKRDEKLQEALWEVFTSECTYFLDQLLVMQEVFLKTLKYLQSRGCLVDVDYRRLFGNLDELCKVSQELLTSLLSAIERSRELSSSISVLSKFQEDVCQTHQMYCLNYSTGIHYLETLKTREDFGIFLKWGEQNKLCKRLHLSDLLVSPLQRFTRYPLLLKNIWKRSTDQGEKLTVHTIIEHVDKSICDLEGKVKWLESFQKIQQLQEMIVWPPIWERNKNVFVPECLRHTLKDSTKEGFFTSPNRQLLHEGKLGLTGNNKILDVYLVLFDDFLLITKIKRIKKRLSGVFEIGLTSPTLNPELHSMVRDGMICAVFDQPIPLNRLLLKNIDSFYANSCGLHYAFIVIHQNRYHQSIGMFTLQAQSEANKRTWMSQIANAITTFTHNQDPQRTPVESSSVRESSEI
ncbi:pleckstrin homology domain-containing family G member 7 isoform X1 [Callorhinchus milii]|uniref:pleckstrin homology domain-containing family G member 7 isoform X1 n=2 Tax=Callorhinchus milii TaxID=7868 RepID=UPI001C3F51C0|nr:pleckstrin homology domain-containing family G member 7 isoform X1 [Callorhinchus milii]